MVRKHFNLWLSFFLKGRGELLTEITFEILLFCFIWGGDVVRIPASHTFIYYPLALFFSIPLLVMHLAAQMLCWSKHVFRLIVDVLTSHRRPWMQLNSILGSCFWKYSNALIFSNFPQNSYLFPTFSSPVSCIPPTPYSLGSPTVPHYSGRAQN